MYVALRQLDQKKDREIFQVDHDRVLGYFRLCGVFLMIWAIISIIDTSSSTGGSGDRTFADNSNSA